MQHLKIGYSDILNMPTAERRFHLGMLVKNKQRENEIFKEQKKNNNGSKGTRKTTISGDALKSRIKAGDVPLT